MASYFIISAHTTAGITMNEGLLVEKDLIDKLDKMVPWRYLCPRPFSPVLRRHRGNSRGISNPCWRAATVYFREGRKYGSGTCTGYLFCRIWRYQEQKILHSGYGWIKRWKTKTGRWENEGCGSRKITVWMFTIHWTVSIRPETRWILRLTWKAGTGRLAGFHSGRWCIRCVSWECTEKVRGWFDSFL